MMRNLVTYENFVALQQTSSHVEELRAKPEYHKFLIGRGGSNIRKVRICTHLIVHMVNVSLPRSKKKYAAKNYTRGDPEVIGLLL